MTDPFPKTCAGGRPNIGLMGGTFDPIHLGHLVTAEEARQQFALDYVVFLPAGYPPHKDPLRVTPPQHRYLMAILAVMSNPFFLVSRFEIDQAKPAYTVDTVRHYATRENDPVNLYFITGADAVLDLLTWKDYSELLDLCTFIAVTRPGYSLARLRDKVGSRCEALLERVHLMEIPALAISSTSIRERVALGKTIKYLTPEPVEQYIVKQGLYKKAFKPGLVLTPDDRQ